MYTVRTYQNIQNIRLEATLKLSFVCTSAANFFLKICKPHRLSGLARE